MRTWLRRSLDLYKLKMSYRGGMLLFMIPGLLVPIFALAKAAHSMQLSLGLTPGAPVGSGPGSLLFTVCLLAAFAVFGLIGMSIGALLYSAVLAVFTPVTFRQALSAIFLCNYPAAWFR
jgi:hypothetical protein